MCQLLGLNANTPTDLVFSFTDFATRATEQDRVAIVVTEPLTTNEDWVALNSGELAVFVDGRRLPP
ncbi:MAG: class II glutamine amidotransferase [Betaproteobacteria bacterium]